MSDSQKTLKNPVSISGVGLHTGEEVTMTFHPAEADKGVYFKRIDLDSQPEIPALASYVVSTDRGTTIGQNDVVINTVEHVLAALAGMQIDNCRIDIDSLETPIMDGSSKPFVEVLQQVGTKDQDALRRYFKIKSPISYKDEEEGIEILAIPADDFHVSVMVDYDTRVLGSQNAYLEKIEDFNEEIASCRTFSFLHELEYLLDNGLIKGGDLNNAIVYVDKEVSGESLKKLQKAFKKDNVSVKANGILDNLDLHYHNEAARHKLLDVVGDLALIGRPLQARIFATKPGHKANTEFSKKVLHLVRKAERGPAIPEYDIDKTPVHDINGVMSVLPHRPPFLLVDKITELSEQHVVGVKNVTMNEPFFIGHFPGAPVMPGVLQVEAMAQVGGILALSTVPDPENYLTYFLRMDDVKFKHKVVPGDTLIFQLTMQEPIRRGIVKMQGYAFVGEKVVAEAKMMAQIVKEKNKE